MSSAAVIYARYSSHNQTEQSIEGQLHDAYTYAERAGYQVIGEYIDRALSGTKDARPDFQRMIRDAEKKQFQTIIVWKLDRFARNRYDSAIYKARLKKFGVRVVSVMEAITDGPEGIILEGLLESMAEYYSANLSENIRRGQQASLAKGWYLGACPPYGYRVQDRRLVPDERTAPVAREIWQRYAGGESPSVIAADLNARGLLTSKGRPWRCASFDRMFDSSAYIGKYTYSGKVVDGLAVPLIDEGIYTRAVERRQKNKRAPAASKARERYLLQGKLFCGHCGALMIGESGRSKTGDVHHYYSCSNRKRHHTCKKRNEKKGFVEWYVCEQTVLYVLDPARMDLIADAVVAQYDKEFSGSQVADLERTVARLDADMARLVDQLLIVPPAALPSVHEKMAAIGTQKAEAEADLARLRLAADIRLTKPQVLAWLRTFSGGDLTDPDYRQRLIDTFINSVYLYDDKIVLFYNIRGGKQTNAIPPLEAIESSDLASNAPPLAGISEPRIIFVGRMLGVVVGR